ncbi:MAG TPA: thiamine-phosphate kinase [Thermodesulfovibrionales bacterium]|nr:thiamine-phosphate kinase [Thermodesulfovibrionales bacterium]
MKIAEIGEVSLLRGIREKFGAPSRGIIAGIGDDCAVLRPSYGNLLLTTDMMVEGVHFDRRLITPYQLGFKIVSVNVSDIYATGGRPRFLLLDVAMGSDMDKRFLEDFLDGVGDAMARYGVKLVGGDLSASRRGIVTAGTLLGYSKRPILRSGARPGDRIYVSGNLGDSACGLHLLKSIKRPVPVESGARIDRPMKWRTMKPLLARHLLPEARNPGPFSRHATAMIDVSDGLFIDLSRLCDESRVGALVCLKEIPLSPEMRKAASALGLEPYGLASSGGEDYELLFTARPEKKINACCIGEITESERIVIDIDGTEKPLTPEGYEHWH